MFKRKRDNILPQHIECYTFNKPKDQKTLSEEDKIAIQEFYKQHNINYRGITASHQNVIFKRTVNFIYIVAHYYDKNLNAPRTAKLGPDKGYGVVRTQAYLFHKNGRILYDLDHDYRTQPKDTFELQQVEHKKVLKLNYDLHDELNNKRLQEVGRLCKNFAQFDKACLDLLKEDDTPRSIDFLKGE